MMVVSPITITPELTDKGLLLRVTGEVYLDTSTDLRDMIISMLTSGHYGRVIVDLQEIKVMDSSGIAALLNARKAAPDDGPTELRVLLALGSQPHRILAAAGMLQHLKAIFDVYGLLDC